MSSKAALFISYDGLTDPLGQSQILPYMVGLSKYYHMHILSLEKKNRYEKEAAQIKKICNHNKINWHVCFFSSQIPGFSFLLNKARLRNKARKISQSEPLFLIHARSYVSALIALDLRRKFQFPFIFDMRGFWADERVEGKIWSLRNPMYRWMYKRFKKREMSFFKQSLCTVSLTEKGKDVIHSWPGLSKINIRVIPTCADLDHFDFQRFTPEDKKNIRSKMQIPEGDFVLGYLGSVGTWYLLDEMLSFFNTMIEYNPESKFFFITASGQDEIRQRAKAHEISQERIIIKEASRRDVPEMLSVVDMGILFIKSCFSKQASSPTKLAEMMGMGIPVVGNKGVGDMDKIIPANQAGVIIDELSDKGYHDFFKSGFNKEFQPTQIREAALAIFDVKDAVVKYHEIYKLAE